MNYETLVLEIQKASEEGVTVEHAERVAATSLFVMNALSERLRDADKDRRMRKRGAQLRIKYLIQLIKEKGGSI